MCVLGVCSGVSDSATSWTVARQVPLSMGFPRQEYWSGLPFPPPGDLPDPGIEPESPKNWQAGSLPLSPLGSLYIYGNFPLWKYLASAMCEQSEQKD